MARGSGSAGCIGGALVILFWVVCALGWVSNIIKVVGIARQDKPATTMFVVRCVGIPIAPLGVVLGYMD